MRLTKIGIGAVAAVVLGLAGTQGLANASAREENARCVAQVVSAIAGPGFGQVVKGLAQTGTLGQFVSEEASTNVCEE